MSVESPSVNASSVRIGHRVEYMGVVSRVVEVTDKRPGKNGGHHAHVRFNDGRSVDLKPGHAMPLKPYEVGQTVTYVAPFTRDRIEVVVLGTGEDGHGKMKVHIALPYSGWDLWVPTSRIAED